MILLNRKVEHGMIHSQGCQYTETRWEFGMEESDIPNRQMLHKFSWVQVIQRKNLSVSNEKNFRSWKCLTWFKASHANTFDKTTKDKQKQEIIKIVERYILDNNTPLNYLYEQAPHE